MPPLQCSTPKGIAWGDLQSVKKDNLFIGRFELLLSLFLCEILELGILEEQLIELITAAALSYVV